MKKTNLKGDKGITLIALVITIIVLLILAGIAISMLAGNNGLINQATNAKKETENQTITEKVKLAVMAAMTEGYGKIDLNTLNVELEKIGFDRGEEQADKTYKNDIKYLPANIEIDGNNFKISKNATVELVEETIKIVCWGDSLTVGTKGDGTTYPDVLQTLCNNNAINAKVYNMGHGGETTNTIAGRQGGNPYTIVNDFTIPTGKTWVEISLQGADGSEVMPTWMSTPGFNPVTINGVEGQIGIQEIVKNESYKYSFSRSTEGTEVSVEAGTQVITQGMVDHKDADILILWTGTNDAFIEYDDASSIKETIAKQLKMTEYVDTDKYIIIGLCGRGTNINNKFGEIYGEQYLNIQGNYGETTGFIDKTTDLDNDKVHFNASGYTKVGNAVYQKLIDLGYIK